MSLGAHHSGSEWVLLQYQPGRRTVTFTPNTGFPDVLSETNTRSVPVLEPDPQASAVLLANDRTSHVTNPSAADPDRLFPPTANPPRLPHHRIIREPHCGPSEQPPTREDRAPFGMVKRLPNVQLAIGFVIACHRYQPTMPVIVLGFLLFAFVPRFMRAGWAWVP
jgi:hypothetical protein